MAAPRMENRPCPLCGGTGFRVWIEAPDLSSGDLAVHRIVRCEACGLLRTDPIVVEADRGMVYGADYQPHHGLPMEVGPMSGLASRLRSIDFQRTAARRHVPDEGLILKLLARLFGLTRRGRFARFWFPGEGRIALDVGCGAGGLAAQLRSIGWKAFGVEIDPGAAGRARELEVDVCEADFSARDFTRPSSWPAEGFDLILFNHSLEHMADPIAALRRARSLLRPGGVVYVATPNAGVGPARAFGAFWYPLDLPRHLSHFEPWTLRRALVSAGLEPTACHKTFSTRSIERSLDQVRRRGRPGQGLRMWDALIRRPGLLRAALRIMELLGHGDNLHCYAVDGGSTGDERADEQSVYLKKGAYHWRETEPRLRAYNAFLAARYDVLMSAARQVPAALCAGVGCGDGRLSGMLSSAGHKVLGLDIDPFGLRIARERVREADFVRADGLRLPIKTGSVGIVVAADVIEHVPDGRALLREIRRVAAPRGLALISTPNRQPDGPADRRHAREWTAREFREALGEHFEVVDLKVSHHRLLERIYRKRIFGRELMRPLLNFAALRLGVNPFAVMVRDERDGLQLLAACRPKGIG